MDKAVSSNPPGRPRTFCTDAALDAAMKVFSEKGFEGASLADLTEAMGINRPSMYAAFGNKENLYLRALDRYTREMTEHINSCFEGLTAKAGVRKLLEDSVNRFTDPTSAGCCFVTQAPFNSAATKAAQQEKEIRRDALTRVLQRRFRQAQESAELTVLASPETLARYYSVVMQGIALQAQHGGSRPDLMAVVDVAMTGWPTG